MKYLMLITMLTFGLLSTSCAQNKNGAPAEVLTAFKTKYPNVTKVEWDKEGADEWEAEFKIDGKEKSANFKADGTWLETEIEIKKSDLPQAVKAAIVSQFAEYEIEEVSMVDTPEHSGMYEVELEKGKTTVEAMFSADGKLLSQMGDDEGDEDDDNDDDGDN